VGVSWAATPAAPGADIWFAAVLTGGGTGGGAGDGASLLIGLLLYLIFCALIGLLVSLFTESMVLSAGAAAGELALPAATAATKSLIEETAASAVNREVPAVVQPLIKGALHAVLVGIALAIFNRSD
jgi:hypothetical protein